MYKRFSWMFRWYNQDLKIYSWTDKKQSLSRKGITTHHVLRATKRWRFQNKCPFNWKSQLSSLKVLKRVKYFQKFYFPVEREFFISSSKISLASEEIQGFRQKGWNVNAREATSERVHCFLQFTLMKHVYLSEMARGRWRILALMLRLEFPYKNEKFNLPGNYVLVS